MNDEIEQLRAELALAKAWGSALYHRAFPTKSPRIEVPARREKCDAQAACCGTDPRRPFGEIAYVAIDVETTGLDPAVDRVVEIALVLVDETATSADGVTREWATLVNPGVAIPPTLTTVHGIDDAAVATAPTFAEAWMLARDQRLLPGPDVLPLAFNAPFDQAMVVAELARAGLMADAQALADAEWIDPLVLVRDVDKFKSGKRLEDACARRGIVIDGAHRALADARATHLLFQQIVPHAWLNSRVVDVLRGQKRRRAELDAELAEFQARQDRRRSA